MAKVRQKTLFSVFESVSLSNMVNRGSISTGRPTSNKGVERMVLILVLETGVDSGNDE
jgi:hypothetical protein